ncbi:MAG: lipid A deacylase LpxR family protein [Oceanospirillaceae bacterium]|nr:lipid A deacylase LpxR family protein [Oceanospirillaceae bacterium]
MPTFYLCLSILLFLPTSPILAGENPWTLNFHFENDLFADTDLNYTNGMRVSWVSPDMHDFLLEKQATYEWIEDVSTFLAPLHPDLGTSANVHTNIVFSLGQLMFTPEDKLKQELDETDRPYAGWLYAGIGYQARTLNKLHSFELNLGVVGPAAYAREAQNIIHDARGIERFHGWDNQLNNELGVQLIFERKRRFEPLSKNIIGDISTDVITHWGGSLGNVATYLNAGVEWRVGRSLPRDFGMSTLRPGGEGNNPGIGDPKLRHLQYHGFIATDGRLVAHNIFLDGNTFSDSHSVAKKRWVADVTIGVSAVYQRWNLSYSQVYRTREFKGQKTGQKYGSLSVSYSY